MDTDRESRSEESYRKELTDGIKFGRKMAIEAEKVSRETEE